MGLFGLAWRFKSEIILAVQFLAALRKTAQEVTREYIKRRLQKKLRAQIGVIAVEIGLLVGAGWLCSAYPGMQTRRIASLVLWGVTLYNLFELFFRTIPELKEVRRQLRSKTGYAVKYFLQISLVTELMQLNIVFLAVCIVLGVSTRTYVASRFSYLGPWTDIASSSAHRR